jgi:PRTRC genetic system ThiF family protein
MGKTHYLNTDIINNVHPARVLLIGCGGTGTYVLRELARIHLALLAMERQGLYVMACDGDHVEEANIGRQTFTKEDIGLNKASVLITRINRFYGLMWEACPEMMDTSLISNANIVISCVDNHATRREIAGSNITTYPFYWLDFGNGKDFAQAILSLNTAEGMILKNIFDLHGDLEDADDDGPSCSLLQALNQQSLFINSIIAMHGINMLWTLLKDMCIDYHGIYINLKSNSIQTKKI